MWLGQGWLTRTKIFPVNWLVYWKFVENELWCLVKNLTDQRMTLQTYARRMWIEEMFGD